MMGINNNYLRSFVACKGYIQGNCLLKTMNNVGSVGSALFNWLAWLPRVGYPLFFKKNHVTSVCVYSIVL